MYYQHGASFGFSNDSSLLRANYDGFSEINVSKHDKSFILTVMSVETKN